MVAIRRTTTRFNESLSGLENAAALKGRVPEEQRQLETRHQRVCGSKGEHLGKGKESTELPLRLRSRARRREEAEEVRETSVEETTTTLEAEETRVTAPEPGLDPARELPGDDH